MDSARSGRAESVDMETDASSVDDVQDGYLVGKCHLVRPEQKVELEVTVRVKNRGGREGERRRSPGRRGEEWGAWGHNRPALAVRGNTKTMHCYYAETNCIDIW